MSKSGGTTKTTSESGLPAWQLPYSQKQVTEASRLYGTGGPQYYPDQQVAGFNPTQQQGQQMLLSSAGGPAQSVGNQAASSLGSLFSTARDVDANPYLAKAVEGAVRPIFQNLTETVLPQIRNDSVGTGTYGGSRMNLGEAQATERATRAALDSTNQLYSNAYGQGLQAFTQGLNLAPQIQGMQFTPGQVTASVGDQQQALEQQRINAEMNKWNYNQALPWTTLTEYSNLIKGPFGGTGTSEVTAPQSSASTQIGGGVLALLPYLGKIFGWW